MKILGLTIAGIIVLYAALFLLQMWFDVFATTFFIKLSITIGVVLVVIVVVWLIKREFVEEEKMRKDKFLD